MDVFKRFLGKDTNKKYTRKVKAQYGEPVVDSSQYYTVEDDAKTKIQTEEKDSNYKVKVFVVDTYNIVKDVLDAIRSEKIICLLNVTALKMSDPDELRRIIEKFKKTILITKGDIVAFDSNWVLLTPKNISIDKVKKEVVKEKTDENEEKNSPEFF